MKCVYICISFMTQTLKLPITSVKEFGKLILNAYTLYDFFFSIGSGVTFVGLSFFPQVPKKYIPLLSLGM